MKFSKNLACLFGNQNMFFLSQDDKARIPLGLPVSKKQTAILIHLEYKVLLPDHNFATVERHKFILLVYAI